MGFLEGIFGKNNEPKNTDSAGHIANPERTGEFAEEDHRKVDMKEQLRHLEKQLEKAKKDADAGLNPEIPISELEEKIANIKAQMPYGSDQKQ